MHCSITWSRGSMMSNTRGFSGCLLRNTSIRSSTCKHKVTELRTDADRETWQIYPAQLLQTGVRYREGVWRKLYLQLRSVYLLLSPVMPQHETVEIKSLKLKIKSCWLTSAYFLQWHHLKKRCHWHPARPAATATWHRSLLAPLMDSSYSHESPLTCRHCITIKSSSYCPASKQNCSEANGHYTNQPSS